MANAEYTEIIVKSKIDELCLGDEMFRLFGNYCIKLEFSVYGWMDYIAPSYTGGQWQGYTLSNGGFYLCPASGEAVAVCVEGNGYQGVMSSDAVGIVASLFALCSLSQHTDKGAELYHMLRAYALDHPEAREIFRAID